MRQSSALRSGSKLRSLLARVLRRCGIDRSQHTHRRARDRRRAFEGMQQLEPRQLLSVAIEMAIHNDVNTPVYVQNASTVNISLGDSITVDLFVTISEDEVTNTTLSGYTLNFAGTNVSISLDEWLRNTDLFPASSGDVFLFSEDAVDDGIVSAGIIGAGPYAITPGAGNGLFLGSLDITLPNAVGDYVLTLTTSQLVDNPTDITHTLEPSITISTPTINSLTFHTVEAATVDIATLPTLTNNVAGNFSTINIVTTNVDPAEFDIHDLKLELAGGLTVSGAGWDSYGDVSLTETVTNGTYQLVGLDDIIGLADGDYTLTVLSAGVFNTAGIPLLVDDFVSFTVDTIVPAIALDAHDSVQANDALTDYTLTVTDAGTIQSVSYTFSQPTLTPLQVNATFSGGVWTLDSDQLSSLLGGTYSVQITAIDEAGNQGTATSSLTVVDPHDAPTLANDDDTSDHAFVLGTTLDTHLSIHEAGDVDWKTFTLANAGKALIRAQVNSGGVLQVKLYSDPSGEALETLITDGNGTLAYLSTSDLPAGTYYIQVVGENSDLVYDYQFLAGDETDLSNSIVGTVYVDDNFDGISNDALGGWLSVTVQLLDTSDNLVTSTTTAADGTYSFTNVISDTYRVRIVLPDGTFQTTSNPSDILLDGAVDQTGVDFGVRDVEVLARNLFYNNSAFDRTISGFDDSDAIATDKSALLPGNIASTSNVSSYSKGINGIMIDIVGLASDTLTVVDFLFRTGNDNTPDSWTAAALPVSIDNLTGQGVNGSDRIVLIWDDGAITKTWLEVQLLATVNTGLAELDSFFFGNAIGDSMNSSVDFNVNASDRIAARDHASGLNTVDIESLYDFNRDGLVNASDRIVARDNATGFTPISRISLTDYAPGTVVVGASQAPVSAADTVGEFSTVELLAMAMVSEPTKLHLTTVQLPSDNLTDNGTNLLDSFVNQ